MPASGGGVDAAARGQKQQLPQGMALLLQDFTKAVLRECPVTDAAGEPLAAPPALWDPASLYRFCAQHFADKAAECSERDRLALRDADVPRRLVQELGLDADSADAEDHAATGFPNLPLAVVLETAEGCGLPEEAINQVTQLTLRASGQDECDEQITASTPINAVHFAALCASLRPSKGMLGVVELCVVLLKEASLLIHAFQCFAALDPRHRAELAALCEALEQHPGSYTSLSMLLEVHPQLRHIGTPKGALDSHASQAGDTPTPAQSRPGTATIVSYSRQDELVAPT